MPCRSHHWQFKKVNVFWPVKRNIFLSRRALIFNVCNSYLALLSVRLSTLWHDINIPQQCCPIIKSQSSKGPFVGVIQIVQSNILSCTKAQMQGLKLHCTVAKANKFNLRSFLQQGLLLWTSANCGEFEAHRLIAGALHNWPRHLQKHAYVGVGAWGGGWGGSW